MNTKLPLYPAVIVACLLGVVGLLLVWLRVSVAIEPTPPETLSVSSSVSKQTEPVEQDTPPVSRPDPAIASRQGLRVSNQTDQPVRVALLARRAETSAPGQPTYGNPVHWDFAPKEGSGKGLMLSLPTGNLKLKKGDILVAFAQDGSRRYWGPYVVGETALPVWNRQTGEWQLILR